MALVGRRGLAEDGARVGWNLVAGIHDAAEASERSVWVDGVAHEVGPVAFDADLGGVRFAEGGALAFAAEAVRERSERLPLFSSEYVQPFGSFAGGLPGGLRLAEGYGVMEAHDVRW